MARPIKEGLDYFPFDVDFFSDTKIKVLKAHYGADGITVFIYILTQIYKDKGYYVIANDDFVDVMADDLAMSVQKIGLILNFLLDRSLLDSKLFKSDKVLTSRSIQLRFQEAKKTVGTKRPIEVETGFWILKKSETKGFVRCTHFLDKSEKNHNKSEKNGSKSEINSINKSKVNKSKRERYGTHTNVFLSSEELQDLKDRFPDSWEEKINRLSSYMETSGRTYANHYAVILQWAEEDSQPQRKATGFTNFEQRKDYDYDALEARAFNKGADTK